MRNLLTGFYLAFCVLSVVGYTNLHANVYEDAGQHYSSLSKNFQNFCFGINQHGQALIVQQASSDRQSKNFKILATEGTEEDETESLSFKKGAGTSDQIYSFLTQPLKRCLYNTIVLPFGKGLLSSSPRYLVLQIFRI
jgi:hypothetical protein